MSQENGQLRVYESYEASLEADKFEPSSEYKLGLEMAIWAIFDNLSGYQCRDLMVTLIKLLLSLQSQIITLHILFLKINIKFLSFF